MERSSDFKDDNLTTGRFDSLETGSSIRCGVPQRFRAAGHW
jgi:hypothetical protein